MEKQQKPVVMCPGCQQLMTLTSQRPVLFTKDLEQVTFTCENCGTSTVRD